jgi:hypothetical protein
MINSSTDPINANVATTGIAANNLQCNDTGHPSIAPYINTNLVQKFKDLTIEDASRLSGSCFPIPPALNHTRRDNAEVTLPFTVQEPYLFHHLNRHSRSVST